MKWGELVEIVEHEGYDMPYAPELDIDRYEAEKGPCTKCGGERWFTGRAKTRVPLITPAWRAFAICLTCNEAEEF